MQALLWSVLLLWLAGPLAGQDRPEAEPSESSPPRGIVLVLTDDQGFGDHSAMGHGVLRTPRLDRLRAESVRFQRFYVSPVCSPTRASLMTGRWNYRTRVVDTWRGRSMMEPEEVTIAEALRAAGYRTGIFGKWHLGDEYPTRAIDQGFDEALVHRGGGLAQPSEPIRSDRRYTDPVLFAQGSETETSGYCTGVYFDAAIGFIERQVAEERPFFAYVATNAPHGPFHDVPEDLLAYYSASDRQSAMKASLRDAGANVDREARVCAMIEDIDRSLGRLLDKLDALGVADDTLVVFLHDNGPVPGRWAGGLRGSKTTVYEGGIRTPCFLRWPSKLGTAGRDISRPAAHVDLMPTLLEWAVDSSSETRSFDGRSLVPLIQEPGADWPGRYLVLQSHRGDVPVLEHQFAIVGERYKLLRPSGFGRETPAEVPLELYDLAEDPGETKNLATELPERVAELRARYRAWFEDVSTTRPDNFAPPRIVVDRTAPARIVLTGQDRRDVGLDGHWLLRLPRRTSFDPEVVVRGSKPIDEVRWVLDRDSSSVAIQSQSVETYADTGAWRRVRLSGIEVPEGDRAVGVLVRREGETKWRPVHQLILRR